MNAEKATEVVNEVLSKALEAATATGNFVVEQAPDVVQQLLTYKMFEAATMSIILALASLVMAWLSKKGWKLAWSDSVGSEEGAPILVASILLAASAAISTYVAWSWIMVLAKIILAPKIFLIEYAAQLVK